MAALVVVAPFVVAQVVVVLGVVELARPDMAFAVVQQACPVGEQIVVLAVEQVRVAAPPIAVEFEGPLVADTLAAPYWVQSQKVQATDRPLVHVPE